MVTCKVLDQGITISNLANRAKGNSCRALSQFDVCNICAIRLAVL